MTAVTMRKPWNQWHTALDDGLNQESSEVKWKPGGNPEPGDRLRFVLVFVWCVACVRAGEAKLRVRARCRVFLVGRPRRWQVVLLCSRPHFEAQDVVYTWVLRQNGSKSEPRDAHCVCFELVLSRSFIKPVYLAWNYDDSS